MLSSEDRLLRVPPFRVGRHRVRPSLLEVETAGRVRTLEPKVMGVLCHLARRGGEAVSRRELLDEGWPDTVVGDETLTRCVSELRKTLGDDARAPAVVGTVPRIGYRLLAPVEWETEGDRPPEGSPTRAAAGEHGRPPLRRWVVVTAVALGAVLLVAVGYGVARDGAGGAEAVASLLARPLTAAPGFEMEPALSPDGERVAYLVNTPSSSHLYVRPVEGTPEPLRVADGGPLQLQSPRWSPDAEEVAYVVRSRDGAAAADETCELRVVSTLGGPERAVGPCPGGLTRTIDWTPDGRSLVAGGHEAAGRALLRVDARTGEDRPLPYDRPQDAVDAHPRVSPDGRRILFRRTVGEEVASVCVLDVATGAVTTLATDTAMLIGHDWLPGGGVVYVSVQVGQATFRRLAAADGVAEPEALAIGGVGLAARPDVAGGRLTFERWRVEIGLFGFDPERPGPLTPFAPSTAFDAYPQISPDGRRVAFISERSGAPQVWVAERDGARPRPVTDLDGLAYSAPRWSPDGARLAFAALDGDGADVFVLDRLDGEPRRIALPGSNEVQPAWSADGRWLYVGSDRSGRMEVWRLPVGGGEGAPITVGGGLAARPSLDGRDLYLMRPDERGLWRRTGDDGEDALFLPGLRPIDLNNWAPADEGVVWVETGSGPDALRSTTSDAPFFAFPGEGEAYALEWDPRSRTGIVAWMGEREVDLALVELGP